MVDVNKIAQLVQALQPPQQQMPAMEPQESMQIPSRGFLHGTRMRGTGDATKDDFLTQMTWKYASNWSRNYSMIRQQNPGMSEEEIYSRIGPRPDKLRDPKTMMRYLSAEANPMSEFDQKKELIKMQHADNLEIMDRQQADRIAMADYQKLIDQEGREFTAGENRKDREFRAGQAREGREFETTQNLQNRAFTATENEKERAIRERQFNLQKQEYEESKTLRDLQVQKLQKEIDLIGDDKKKEALSQIVTGFVSFDSAFNDTVLKFAEDAYSKRDAKNDTRTLNDFITNTRKLLEQLNPTHYTEKNIASAVASGIITQEDAVGVRKSLGLQPPNDTEGKPVIKEDSETETKNSKDTTSQLRESKGSAGQSKQQDAVVKKPEIEDYNKVVAKYYGGSYDNVVASIRNIANGNTSTADKLNRMKNAKITHNALQNVRPDLWDEFLLIEKKLSERID